MPRSAPPRARRTPRSNARSTAASRRPVTTAEWRAVRERSRPRAPVRPAPERDMMVLAMSSHRAGDTELQRRPPVRVAAVNDYEIIVQGVAALLEQYPDRLEVCARVIIGEPITQPIDVALYDTYGRVGIAEPA